jgi:hypothetical protein
MPPTSKEFSRIDVVMSASHCKKHKAELDKPCWVLPIKNGRGEAPAVCGARVKRAGFNGGVRVSSNNQTPSARLK